MSRRTTLERKAREALTDEIKTGLHVPFYVQPHVLVNILDERDELLETLRDLLEAAKETAAVLPGWAREYERQIDAAADAVEKVERP